MCNYVCACINSLFPVSTKNRHLDWYTDVEQKKKKNEFNLRFYMLFVCLGTSCIFSWISFLFTILQICFQTLYILLWKHYTPLLNSILYINRFLTIPIPKVRLCLKSSRVQWSFRISFSLSNSHAITFKLTHVWIYQQRGWSLEDLSFWFHSQTRSNGSLFQFFNPCNLWSNILCYSYGYHDIVITCKWFFVS